MSKLQLILLLALSHIVSLAALAQGLNSRAFDTLPSAGDKPVVVGKRPVNTSIGQTCPVLGQPVNSTGSGYCNVTLQIGMGHYTALEVCESELTEKTYTVDILPNGYDEPGQEVLLISRGEQIIWPERGLKTTIVALRQIRMPEIFVDVVTISKWEFEIRFYHIGDVDLRRAETQEGFKWIVGNGQPQPTALYEVSGKPFAVYNLKNPNPPATDRLRINYIRDGAVRTDEIYHDPANDTWTDTRDGQILVEKTSVINPENPCERTEVLVKKDNGIMVSRRTRVFRGFPWAQELVTESEEERGQIKTTTYTYYQNPREHRYTQVETTTFPDGSWETYDYPADARGSIHQTVIASGGSRAIKP